MGDPAEERDSKDAEDRKGRGAASAAAATTITRRPGGVSAAAVYKPVRLVAFKSASGLKLACTLLHAAADLAETQLRTVTAQNSVPTRKADPQGEVGAPPMSASAMAARVDEAAGAAFSRAQAAAIEAGVDPEAAVTAGMAAAEAERARLEGGGDGGSDPELAALLGNGFAEAECADAPFGLQTDVHSVAALRDVVEVAMASYSARVHSESRGKGRQESVRRENQQWQDVATDALRLLAAQLVAIRSRGVSLPDLGFIGPPPVTAQRDRDAYLAAMRAIRPLPREFDVVARLDATLQSVLSGGGAMPSTVQRAAARAYESGLGVLFTSVPSALYAFRRSYLDD